MSGQEASWLMRLRFLCTSPTHAIIAETHSQVMRVLCRVLLSLTSVAPAVGRAHSCRSCPISITGIDCIIKYFRVNCLDFWAGLGLSYSW